MRWLPALALVLPVAADAQCLTASTGAGCATARIITVPQSQLGPPPVEVGEFLPRGKYTMVLNARWYGLPDARDGWVYMRVEDDLYRVDYRSMEVLERVTAQAGANWP